VVFTVLNAALMVVRIRCEETALASLAGDGATDGATVADADEATA
jgi:hypothetical protein